MKILKDILKVDSNEKLIDSMPISLNYFEKDEII